MKHNRFGFTIVELLIVIVVIGILAAISIVAYNNVSNKANDATVASEANNFMKKMEIYKAENGTYPQSLSQFPADLKISKGAYDESANNVYYITNTAENTFAFGVRSKSKKGYIMTNSGLQEGTTVSGYHTAAAIDSTWGAADTFPVQGFNTATNPKWHASWSLVN